MAALKRAQAHQRRGCPEQQQQPLLAVKVELDQLIISILDDPSVSRVMREAGFSSPAVKATIDLSMNNSTSPLQPNDLNFGGIGPKLMLNHSSGIQLAKPNMSTLVNLQKHRDNEVQKVSEIMARVKKRNPILVGDSEPEIVVKELLRKIESKEIERDWVYNNNIQIISIDKGMLFNTDQVKELERLIENRIGNGGVIIDLGDLKWIVSFGELQQQQGILEMRKAVVLEMSKLLARFKKLWFIGIATCETYLRCQVYHSTMENDWDLQAVPMASRSPPPRIFPRLGTERFLNNPMEPVKAVSSPLPAVTRGVSENLDPILWTNLCPQCSEEYEKELAKLTAIEKSFSELQETRPSLPQWLQNAKLTDQPRRKDEGILSKQKSRELQKKWRDTCLHLHPSFHKNIHSDRPASMFSMTSLCDPDPGVHPKLHPPKPLRQALQLDTNRPVPSATSPPGSPVRTDLVLGRKGTESSLNKVTEDQAKDFLGCISSEPQTNLLDKFANASDANRYKKLVKALMKKAWWQADAASATASSISNCRLGNRKRPCSVSRGDIWLLFTGPDRVGKKKMGLALAEEVCGSAPVMICLGTRRNEEEQHRGKTMIDHITEAVQINPFSVIMLEDIDEADMLVQGNIKRAIERGRLVDSHGREVTLGNTIFIITGDWSTADPEAMREGRFVDEKKIATVASGDWQLGLTVREKSPKRHACWLQDEERPMKPRKESSFNLSLNLGLASDDNADGSPNSSDITIDHEDKCSLVNQHFSITSVPHDLLSIVDESIVFMPVDYAFVRREIRKAISSKFSMVIDEKLSLKVDDDVLDKILGGLWHDMTSLDEWIENVLEPSFDQLKGLTIGSVVHLVVESDSGQGKNKGNKNWLPSSIFV